jgi:hypothetical protein
MGDVEDPGDEPAEYVLTLHVSVVEVVDPRLF